MGIGEELPSVSVLVPVLNERRHLPLLLKSISEQTYPLQLVEVIIIDGGSTDGSVEWVRDNIDRYPFTVRVVANPMRYQAHGLNLGLSSAQGDVIIRMDAHSMYDQGYIESAVSILRQRIDVVNVGGRQLSVGTCRFSRAAALAMNSPLGVGGARFRYVDKECETDSVFLGAWRRHELVQAGGWNSDWIINEDGELNLRLRRLFPDRKLLLTPTMKVCYHPRSSLRGLAKQYFRYGYWRVKTFNHFPESLRVSHLAPVLLLIGLVGSAVVTLWTRNVWALLVPVLYLSGMLVGAGVLCLKHGQGTSCLVTAMCLVTMHCSWGVGAIGGTVRFGFPLRALVRLGGRLARQ